MNSNGALNVILKTGDKCEYGDGDDDGDGEKDDDFHLIDGIFEGADSSGHVVRDDPVKGAGEEGDDEGEDGNVEDNLIILCKGGDGQ